MAGRKSPYIPQDPEERAQRIRELRAIGLFALENGCGGLSMWQYFKELRGLAVAGMYPERLEARIAICLAGEIRPAALSRSLSELRQIRKDAGELSRFEAFEQEFLSRMKGRPFTAHGYDRKTFDQLDHGAIWSQVAHHVSLLNDWGYQAFLNSGTLLGVVRDGQLIKHDDDVDLAVILNSDTLEGLAKEWSDLIERLRAADMFDEESFDDPKIIKLRRSCSVQIDLFPGWINDGKVFVYPHTCGELSEQDVLPLGACAVTGNPVPAEPEKMLVLNYGKDWREPNPYFSFPWKQAQRRFAAFREHIERELVHRKQDSFAIAAE